MAIIDHICQDRWHFLQRGSASVCSDLMSGAVDDNSTIVSSASTKKSHFPYSYIRSKLSTLPEELQNTVSRRESVTSKCSAGAGAGYHSSYATEDEFGSVVGGSQSEVGPKQSCLAPSQRLKMLALRRKKSRSLADLQQSCPPIPEKPRVAGGNSRCDESGYDSDTRKSAETVSPKSSDKSDSDSSGETSGSFTSDRKDSDEESLEEPHYQVPPRRTVPAVAVGEMRPITPQKPPRKSKLPEPEYHSGTARSVARTRSQPEVPAHLSQDRDRSSSHHGQERSSSHHGTDRDRSSSHHGQERSSSHHGTERDRSSSANRPSQPSLTSKNFKVMHNFEVHT